jgi:hypothetical protein
MEGFQDDGVSRCGKYAFGPNQLHYCGPTSAGAAYELLARLSAGESTGASELLRRFETLFPYLSHIARENDIRDPFDSRVVEAYWIGNGFLDTVFEGHFYQHLKDDLQMKRKMGAKIFEGEVAEKIRHGGVPHHSFHVLNVWKGMGEKMLEGVRDVAECLVSAGKVTDIDGPSIVVETDRLMFDGKRLALVSDTRSLPRPFDASEEWDFLAVGDTVSYHWGVMCEKISSEQAEQLKRYTKKSVALANEQFL